MLSLNIFSDILNHIFHNVIPKEPENNFWKTASLTQHQNQFSCSKVVQVTFSPPSFHHSCKHWWLFPNYYHYLRKEYQTCNKITYLKIYFSLIHISFKNDSGQNVMVYLIIENLNTRSWLINLKIKIWQRIERKR